MKKNLKFIFLVICISLLTSCGEQYVMLDVYNDIAVDNKVTLRFISQWAGADVRGQVLKKALDEFTLLNPEISIVNESMSGQDFLTKLKIDFASGNDPDVFGLWPGANMLSFIEASKVADLTQTLEQDLEWKGSFDKSTWYYVTENGRTYGIPFEIIYQTMFINRDLFEQYNIKVPENFTGLLKAVSDFRRNGVIPIAYNAQLEGGYFYQNIIASLGGRMESQQPFKAGNVNDCFLEASDYMKELYKLGAFPENSFSLSGREMNNLFFEKKAAMIVQRSEFIGELTKYAVENAEMIPFPYIESGKADKTSLIYGLGSGTFFVSQNAWDDPMKRKAATKLLKFITSEEISNLFISETQMLPAVKSEYPDAYYGGFMRHGRELIDITKELIIPPDNSFDKSVWDNIIINDLPYVLEDKTDAEALWREAAAAVSAQKINGKR